MIDSLTLPMMRQDLLWRKPKDLDADVRFGSLADLQDNISLMSAFGGEADVQNTRYSIFDSPLSARSRHTLAFSATAVTSPFSMSMSTFEKPVWKQSGDRPEEGLVGPYAA